MIRFASIASSVVLAILCIGCSVRYTERVPGFQPGYADQRLGESTYQVRVGEAWPKDWADLEKFAVYRAADITEANSKRYFVILNSSSQTNSYYIASPATSTTSGTATQIGGTTYFNATTTTLPSTVGSISGGWYTLDFKILSDSELPNYRRVVDSQQVKSDLKYFIDSRR